MSFETAHNFAMEQAKEFKAVWRSITNETYGQKKADVWRPEAVEAFDAAAIAELQERLAATDQGLDAANQRMGMLNAEQRRHADAASRHAATKDLANRHPRIADKLLRDQIELDGWIEKVKQTRAAAGDDREAFLVCPHCDCDVRMVNGKLIPADPQANDPEAIANLPEYEKALDLMQKAVANGKRDLAESSAAAKLLAELDKDGIAAPTEAELAAARKHLDELKAERATLTEKATKLANAERESKLQAVRVAKAKAAHQSVQAWSRIADALAPDGIPGEILAAALEPLNERLSESSTDADWLRPCVGPDMSIGAAYPMQSERPYALLSESEKWRVDAMLAEAVSRLSGLCVLVLDRFDVLDLQGRGDLITWLDGLVEPGEIQSALLFGTLKSMPTGLPDAFEAIWIDQGVVEQVKEAA